jgi:hypothetical protein
MEKYTDVLQKLIELGWKSDEDDFNSLLYCKEIPEGYLYLWAGFKVCNGFLTCDIFEFTFKANLGYIGYKVDFVNEPESVVDYILNFKPDKYELKRYKVSFEVETDKVLSEDRLLIQIRDLQKEKFIIEEIK